MQEKIDKLISSLDLINDELNGITKDIDTLADRVSSLEDSKLYRREQLNSDGCKWKVSISSDYYDDRHIFKKLACLPDLDSHYCALIEEINSIAYNRRKWGEDVSDTEYDVLGQIISLIAEFEEENG